MLLQTALICLLTIIWGRAQGQDVYFPNRSHVISVPGNYPTIQKALDAAPDDTTILVTPNTYNENPTLSGKHHITIFGNGGQPVINGGFSLFNCSDVVVFSFECHNAGTAAVYASGGGNIYVYSMSAIGGQVGYWMRNFSAGSTCQIRVCSVSGAGWGYYMEGNTNPVVSSCTASHITNWGIFCGSSFGAAQLSNCTAQYCGLSCIYAAGDHDNRTDTITIDHCNGFFSSGYYGVETSGLRSSAVSNSYAGGNHGYGFISWYTDNASYTNCNSVQNSDGFDFYTCRQGVIDHCFAAQNSQSGITMLTAEPKYGAANVAISNCTLTSNASGGVYALTGWNVGLKNTISAFNGYGIVRNGSTNFGDSYNDVYHNGTNYFNYSPSGIGDISQDPAFVNGNHLGYHSPCIHAGDPAIHNTDGTRSNIGAFDPDNTKRSVLLVHGTWSNAQTWNSGMFQRLSQNYTVEAVDFPNEKETMSNETYIELQAKALARRILELQTRSGQKWTDLVCHSMGGLAARYYLEHPSMWPKDANNNPVCGVAKLIMLGTPNWGTDGAFLDPVATIPAAHRSTQPKGLNGFDSSATDTYQLWSHAVNEQFAEWQPAPTLAGNTYAYPTGYKLARWLSGNGSYQSPIQSESYAFAYFELSVFGIYGSDYNAVRDVLNAFPVDPRSRRKQHLAYYPQMAQLLGGYYPRISGGTDGIDKRLVSQFLYDLNVTYTDISGASVYMAAGTSPIADIVAGITVFGPFNNDVGNGGIDNDGVVPTDSALGKDPITNTYLYPTAKMMKFPTYHLDLTGNSSIINQVAQWLQE